MKLRTNFEIAICAAAIITLVIAAALALIKPGNDNELDTTDSQLSVEYPKVETTSTDGQINVTFFRAENSVYSETGTILAEVYYDKAVLSGNKDGVSAINDYFESKSRFFYNGFDETAPLSLSLPHFYENIEEKRNAYGDAGLAQPMGRHPCALYNTHDTELKYVDQDVICFKGTEDWFAGGVSRRLYFGSTFDLNTGELLPFDRLVDIDPDVFRNDLASFLYETTLEWDYSQEMAEEYLQIYGANEKHNYELINYGLMLNYEYYYDGESIFLILNNFIGNGGFIVKWNGKTGNEFEAEFVFDAV